jgi:ParB family transcriptional regulator, chromosome partitioning protein
MSKIKTGLGRGLDALINPHSKFDVENYIATTESSENTVAVSDNNDANMLLKLPVGKITTNPFQPRINFDPTAHEELKNSILTNGLIQPITVRKITDDSYQLISGERRFRACKDIGYKEIPAYVIKVDSDAIMLALALIENIQREKLNPIEVGLAYKRLMEECNLTQEEIAIQVGKDRSTVANSIRLLKLPQELQEALVKEELSMGHARALINLNDPNYQLLILKQIKDNNLSVRKVEQLVKDFISGKPAAQKVRQSTDKHSSNTAGLSAVEDKIRRIMGTKVNCKLNQNGSGEITLEFYSDDELERLIELFSLIEKSNL